VLSNEKENKETYIRVVRLLANDNSCTNNDNFNFNGKFMVDKKEDKQQQFCNEFHDWTIEQMISNGDPTMVLMTILGQTIKIMKTSMPSGEYQAVMDMVYHSKDEIKEFSKPTIQ